MPQAVDFEALVCGGGDGKIVCVATLLGAAGGPKTGETPLPPPPLDDPDLPAESFRLPVEVEIDWVDRNAAAVYDRDDSTKEITNPKSHQHQNPPNPNVKLHSSSQRYPAKPKASLIGFPNKLQHSGYLGRSARRHAANVRIFPKKKGIKPGGGKSALPESEPTSPKVSCIGRVLSDRDRNRCRTAVRRAPCEASRESSSVAASSAGGGRRTGLWASIVGFFCCGQGRQSAVVDEEELPCSRTTTAKTKTKTTPSAASSFGSRVEGGEAAFSAPGPGLGGMKRFASGRRPASWGGDLEHEIDYTAKSGPLPATASQPHAGILGRRSAAPLEDLDCDRDWESAGPASV